MDVFHRILIGCVGVLVVGGIVGAVEHVSVREERARLEERQKADTAIMAVKDAALKTQGDQLKAATDAFENFKRDQDAKMTALQFQFAAARTPQQSADLTAILLGLRSGDVKAAGTTSAPTIEAPRAQLEAYEKDCEECKIKLTSATHSLELASQREVFLNSQRESDADKIARLTKERNDAQKISNGGSVGVRVRHDIKAGFFGAAVEAVLLALTGHLK